MRRWRVSDIDKQEKEERRREKEEKRQKRLRLSERGYDDPRSPAYNDDSHAFPVSSAEGTQVSDAGSQRPGYPSSDESSVSDCSISGSESESDISNHKMPRSSVDRSEYESESQRESESELSNSDMGRSSSNLSDSISSSEMSGIPGLDLVNSGPAEHTTSTYTGYSDLSSPMARSHMMNIRPEQRIDASDYFSSAQSPPPSPSPPNDQQGRIQNILNKVFGRVAEAMGASGGR
ncbi:hypothetical protein I302_108783 [Kwoniella bestiolae CBS 10118]|uniref:Uncharacterized protein n=1 Tax=Kwoniella bestiolae CBS 10118 TaxID=1296100 RepID=A0A1B9FU24_9TREE|nr:hypothetical protein I302_07920 [Kwoniella bestiolae CBS 10118]OCF22275.1 hypothetical protein I302_07920 [Kwoniella bestiolae CBS 10118]